MVTADSDGDLTLDFMALFNQRFAKISVAKFFDAVGYCHREYGGQLHG